MRRLAGLLAMPAAMLLLFAGLLPALAVLALGLPSLGPILADPLTWSALRRGLWLSGASILLGWPLGVLAAFGLWEAGRTARRVVLGLAVLPLLLPTHWAAIGLAAIGARLGPADAPHVLLQIAARAVPAGCIVLLVLTGFLNRLDPVIMRVALVSGATPGQMRRLVLLPNLGFPLAAASLAALGYTIGHMPVALAPAILACVSLLPLLALIGLGTARKRVLF
jgi:ABC-type spermidine/putrescine transport system permease subunit II